MFEPESDWRDARDLLIFCLLLPLLPVIALFMGTEDAHEGSRRAWR